MVSYDASVPLQPLGSGEWGVCARDQMTPQFLRTQYLYGSLSTSRWVFQSCARLESGMIGRSSEVLIRSLLVRLVVLSRATDRLGAVRVVHV